MKTIIDLVFLFAGKYIKGYKTIILAAGTFTIGAWEWITGSGLFGFLCASSETFQALALFCDIDSTKFYSIIIMVVGAINMILRKLTDTPLGDAGPSAYTAGRPSAWRPVWIVLWSIFFLVLVFILIPALINVIR